MAVHDKTSDVELIQRNVLKAHCPPGLGMSASGGKADFPDKPSRT